MLKFLDNRFHQKAKKSPIKYKPQMIYGISAEAPSEFQTPHTIIHQNTYVSPYLNFQEKRSSCLPTEKGKNIKPEWTNKINLQLVQEQKIISVPKEDGMNKSTQSRYRKSYYDELNTSQHRFKKTKGQFTNFIQKNNHYKSVGPIHGEERTNQRIEQTKKSVWFKPDISQQCLSNSKKNSIMYTTYFDLKRQNSFNDKSLAKNQSTMTSNSKMLTQKTRIRDNRKRINNDFQINIEERKKTSIYNFQLPKIASELQTGYDFYGKKIISNQSRPESAQDLKDLDQFQKNLRKKFR